MSQVTHIGTIVVPVADQDAALSFYMDQLGFEKRLDASYAPGQRWVEVAPPGAATSIALVQGSGPIEVSLATRDAAADLATLQDAGADTDPELVEMPSVPPMFTFRDPDGNHFRVVQRS